MAVARGSAAVISGLLLCLTLVSLVAAHGRGGVIRPRFPVQRGCSDGAPSVPGPDETVFNILHYGAIEGGQKDSTEAFMSAWQAACRGPPGRKSRLVVPKGVFKLGPVVFQGPCSGPLMIVQVLGTIKATTDLSEYSSPEWILFETINGLRVIGQGGTFDGLGPSVWKYDDCSHNPNCEHLPANLKFVKITDGVFRGLRSVDSKGFHLFITDSSNFKVQRVRITAPAVSPNTDGIHISDSRTVTLANTTIGTGDDCVSIGKNVTGITVARVICGPGHGISVGSLGKYENEGDVTKVLVKNCTLKGTENGVRIKTFPASLPSQATGISFEDLIMDNVKFPIVINQEYNCGSNCNKEPSKVKISNVQYRNIKGTSTSPVSINLVCSKSFPCQNVTFFDVDLKHEMGATTTATCVNAQPGFNSAQSPDRC